MIRAQIVRLNPTPEQRHQLLCAAGVARYVWNWALDEYKAAKGRGERMRWAALQRQFNRLKAEQCPWISEVSKSAYQTAFADLRKSINTYYKAKKTGSATIRFPGFRKRSKKIGGFGVQNDTFRIDGNTVWLPRIGAVNTSHPLRFNGKIMSGRVKERAGRWYLTIAVELKTQPVVSAVGAVGIDFGLKNFATLSTGEVYENQVYFRRSEAKLARLQRALFRKKKGSNNRARWKLRVARMHERVRNQRLDYIHKFTTAVTQAFAVVCVEDLNLKGLHRTRLAKSFSDAGIGGAIRQLSYKATWLQKVGRFFPSSQLCHLCGRQNTALILGDRQWTCECGAHHDRDFNASKNIELEGKRLLAGAGWVGVTPVEPRASATELAPA